MNDLEPSSSVIRSVEFFDPLYLPTGFLEEFSQVESRNMAWEIANGLLQFAVKHFDAMSPITDDFLIRTTTPVDYQAWVAFIAGLGQITQQRPWILPQGDKEYLLFRKP